MSDTDTVSKDGTDGLVTVAWESMDNKLDPNDKLVYEVKFPRNGDKRLVYKSQAEELLAGRDTVIETQANSIDKLERKVRHWQERAEKAEANLEFIERVKGVNEKYANALAFLEMGENDDPEEFAECFWNKFIALEAKLAAAEKALKEADISLNAIGNPEPHDPPDAYICGVIARGCLVRMTNHLTGGEL